MKLATEGHDIDLRALLVDAPESRISARSTLDIVARDQGVEVTADGVTDPSTLGGAPLPASGFHATYGEQGLTGTATLAEPGMPLTGTFVLEPHGVLSIEAHAPRFALERAPRIAAYTGARGNVELRVKGRLEQQRLDATVNADLDGLSLGALTLGRGHVTARLRGPLGAPRELALDGSVNGKALKMGSISRSHIARRQGDGTPRATRAQHDARRQPRRERDRFPHG